MFWLSEPPNNAIERTAPSLRGRMTQLVDALSFRQGPRRAAAHRKRYNVPELIGRGVGMTARLAGTMLVALLGCSAKQEAKVPGVLQAVAPGYSDIAIQARAETTVDVLITVLPTGRVSEAKVVAGANPVFPADKFERHAQQWVFEPAEVFFQTTIHFTYELLPEDVSDDVLGTAFVGPMTMEVRCLKPPVESTHVSREVKERREALGRRFSSTCPRTYN